MKLGLRRAPRNALYKSWSLSLIPLNRWNEMLIVLQQEVDAITPEFPQARRFAYYIRNQWLRLADIVYAGTCVRTNNISEAWNRWARRKFGIHPNTWIFLDRMANDMRVVSARWARRHRLCIHRGWLRNTVEITNLCALLNIPNGITMEEFVRSVINYFEYDNNYNIYIQNNPGPHDEEDPQLPNREDLVPLQ